MTADLTVVIAKSNVDLTSMTNKNEGVVARLTRASGHQNVGTTLSTVAAARLQSATTIAIGASIAVDPARLLDDPWIERIGTLNAAHATDLVRDQQVVVQSAIAIVTVEA